jgi:hypothetical protein
VNLPLLRAVAALDGANVLALTALSPAHGAAAAAGYAPAVVGTALAHLAPRYRAVARVLCTLGLIPNTIGAVTSRGPTRRSRALSLYVGIGGAVVGIGYLGALRR